MIKWFKQWRRRVCIEKAEDIHNVRYDLKAAESRLEINSAKFHSLPAGLILRAQFPDNAGREADKIIISDWQTIQAIKDIVLPHEKAEVERLQAKLNELLDK